MKEIQVPGMQVPVFAVVYYRSGGRNPQKILHGIWTSREAAKLAQTTLLGATAKTHINNTLCNDCGVVCWISELATNTPIGWDLVAQLAQPEL